MPVTGSIVIQGGKSTDVNVSGSPSTSSKMVLASSGSCSIPSSPFCGAKVPVTIGASFAPITVTVTVAVSKPPSPSLISYVIAVRRVSPTSRSSNSPFVAKLNSPFASIVKNPPWLPATGCATLSGSPPTWVTVSTSPSGSISLPVII